MTTWRLFLSSPAHQEGEQCGDELGSRSHVPPLPQPEDPLREHTRNTRVYLTPTEKIPFT